VSRKFEDLIGQDLLDEDEIKFPDIVTDVLGKIENQKKPGE
jgi:hypothetical protein